MPPADVAVKIALALNVSVEYPVTGNVLDDLSVLSDAPAGLIIRGVPGKDFVLL
jgi:hypothetical protein